ncbi:MAG: hypothetical protein M3N49_09975, partial [Candidatus Eremiobacteraeota bacterium]|nr:hypothetical protein [Candidatus Eremiobacteraeota bacterium]
MRGAMSAHRLVVAGLAAVALLFALPAGADARTRLDAQVDSLTVHQLLTSNAATLVDPGRQRRARNIADIHHAASAGWGLVQILAFWWLWRSGGAARIRD